jgi:hypothetical protein
MRTSLLAADPQRVRLAEAADRFAEPACCARSGGALCSAIWHAKRSNSSMPDRVGWRTTI